MGSVCIYKEPVTHSPLGSVLHLLTQLAYHTYIQHISHSVVFTTHLEAQNVYILVIIQLRKIEKVT